MAIPKCQLDIVASRRGKTVSKSPLRMNRAALMEDGNPGLMLATLPKLPKGLSRKRANNILGCLGKMLRHAHEIELLEVVPKVKLLKVAPPRFDFLTFDELSRIIEA